MTQIANPVAPAGQTTGASSPIQNLIMNAQSLGLKVYQGGGSIYSIAGYLNGFENVQLDNSTFVKVENQNGHSIMVKDLGPDGKPRSLYIPCLRQLTDSELASQNWKFCQFKATEDFNGYLIRDGRVLGADQYKADLHGPVVRTIEVKAGAQKIFAVPADWSE